MPARTTTGRQTAIRPGVIGRKATVPVGRRSTRGDADEEPTATVEEPTPEDPEAAAATAEEATLEPKEPKPVPQISRKVPAGSAQKQLNKFWKKFRSNRAGRPTIVLPFNPFATDPKPTSTTYGPTIPTVATAQFDEAAASCKANVEKIARECRKLNQKYRDYYFDLSAEDPRYQFARYCIDGFEYNDEATPKGVKRVEDIFDEPSFFKDGVAPGDIRQGSTGDCWFLAAVATITNIPGLLEKVCVARDEEVGVYGFVFFRDGEWISSIVDDQLYLSQEDYHEADSELKYALWGKAAKESVYNETYLKGSDALYFASCEDKNETWLPLLEKAYAKAHGDYSSIEGGFTGEAVEDLTGGVTSEVFSQDILSKDKFWKEELMKVNEEFLFAGAIDSITDSERDGVYAGHAYSVLKAREIDGHRFVLVRNPWGKSEWKGAWSDGSKEWTPYWIQQLDHKFGDDGSFWMSYKDFLRTFSVLERTRLFDSSWSVASAWVSEHVEWENTYSKNRFQINLPEASKVVIVLQQLDTRYFKGLEGEYIFRLHFRIHRPEDPEYLVRSRANCDMSRSVSCEVELEAGVWDIAYKITATKVEGRKSVEEAVQELSVNNRKKFLQVGMSYDLAFAKGRTIVVDPEEEAEESEKESEDGDEAAAKETKGPKEPKPAKVLADKVPKTETTPETLPAAPEPPTSDVTEPPVSKKDAPSTAQGDKADKKSSAEPAKETEEKSKETSEEKVEKPAPGPVRYMLVPITGEEESDTEDEENLWNAVAVVGLRVYSQQKDITVQVIRPKGATKLLLDPDDKSQDISKGEKEESAESKDKPASTGKEGDEDVEGGTDGAEENKVEGGDTKEEDTKPEAEGKKEEVSQDKTEETSEAAKIEGSGTLVEAPVIEQAPSQTAGTADETLILSSDPDNSPPVEGLAKEGEPEKAATATSAN
ncbi:uncharacterized protein DFL_006508 [Arthrobotrys flagrans]|uniref:Calpain catalytic domain-containing protein n=1 Tax=Arthrobotrys flagrans TaxID=97331 RepID=A0A437A0N0_ARTFL|nr:hypothetical protein DFL_006508 [Arthrobotrys flagrans]